MRQYNDPHPDNCDCPDCYREASKRLREVQYEEDWHERREAEKEGQQ